MMDSGLDYEYIPPDKELMKTVCMLMLNYTNQGIVNLEKLTEQERGTICQFIKCAVYPSVFFYKKEAIMEDEDYLRGIELGRMVDMERGK